MLRRHSWGHTRVEWLSGASREGWLHAGDGMDFPAAVAAEVALRLSRGEGSLGAYTPGALFGLEVAIAAGGKFLVDHGHESPVRGEQGHRAGTSDFTRTINLERMSRMPTNTAAWLGAKRAKLEVKSAPYTSPRADEIVVKNHAVAINPLDWIIQVAGTLVFSWIKYPFVLGADLAGEVVEVGTAVTRFKVGDRVLGHAVGTDKKRNSSAEGAFQEYTVVLAHMAAPIPSTMPYENAAVLPLALSTAACGLFQQDYLALHFPSATPTPSGKALLVWGGSTSVGSNAIQLAVAAGYEVITTSSPRNFDYVTKLGASQVFDYNSTTVVEDIIEAFKGKTIAGAIAFGSGSAEACLDVVHACNGNTFVAMASSSVSFETLTSRRGRSFRLLHLILRLVSSNVSLQVKARSRRIRTKVIFGSSLMDNEVSRVIYEDFLPKALADGRYVAAPEPYVVGKGLDHVQAGFDAHMKGVSAKKVVVSL
jgi:NADPH:quinone reductase-like Zn-dependent oxidoreductase